MFYKLLVLIVFGFSVVGCGSADEGKPSWKVPDLSIGAPNLTQDVTKIDVANGVEFYDILRGFAGEDYYILSSGVLNDFYIKRYISLLNELSIDYSLEAAAELAPQGNKIGDIIRIKNLQNKQDAESVLRELKNNGLIFNVVYSAQEGLQTNGPFRISLLKIDLNIFNGRVENFLANNIMQGAETVSSMSQRKKTIAGINGGFFVFDQKVGDYGAPAGIYVENGLLIREAVNQRPVLIFDNSKEKTNIIFGSSVRTELFLKQGVRSIRLNGLNRMPGLILNCGGYGSQPFIESAHDFLCINDNEVVAFNRAYGEYTPKNDAMELVLSASGDVVSVAKSTGTRIEDGYTYIQFSGNRVGDANFSGKIELVQRVYVDNEEFELRPGISMVSGGPTLLLNGVNADELRALQGWNPYPRLGDGNQNMGDNSFSFLDIEDREAFYGNWVLRRHPRTAIGLTSNNILYMVVVYGRNPGFSEGATITEMSHLMKALGANQAMNLDGGGSSVMVLKDRPTGPFSDPIERMVSDGIFLIGNN